MNKRIVITVFVGLLIAMLAWVGISYLNEQKVEDVFKLIPSNASIVLEVNDVQSLEAKLKSDQAYQGLQGISVSQDFLDVYGFVKKQIAADEELSQHFSSKSKIMCSLHASVSKDLGVLWYIPFDGTSYDDYILEKIQNKKNEFIRIEKRMLEGKEVYDIIDVKKHKTYTFIWYKNVLVLSSKGSLIDEVVRLIRSDFENHFIVVHANPNMVKAINKDAGLLYVNYGKLSTLLQVFASDSVSHLMKGVDTYADFGTYEMELQPNKLFMHGYTNGSINQSTFLSSFLQQKPQVNYLLSYIPSQAYAAYFWGAQDLKSWYRNYSNYQMLQDNDYLEHRKDNEEHWKVNLEHELLPLFSNQFLLLYLPSRTSQLNTEKVFLARLRNSDATAKKLESYRLRNASAYPTLYQEFYEGYKIYEINLNNAPYWICGSLATGFNETYYTIIHQTLVVGNSIDAVKQVIKSVQDKEVWLNDSEISRDLKELTASNFSVLIRANVLKTDLKSSILNKQALGDYEKNKGIVHAVSFIAIQYSNTDNQYYTNCIITHALNKVNTEQRVQVPLEEVKSTHISTSGIYETVKVSDQWTDVFYIDSSRNISLIDTKGQLAWTYRAHEPLTSRILSADMNKDQSSDYVFSTSHAIYAVNKKGELLSGYPLALGDTMNVSQLAIFDYDKTKNYRLAVVKQANKIVLMDMKGKALEGWLNKEVGGLIAKVEHVRIGTNDRILVLNQRGDYYLFNRKGELQKGFPVSVNHSASSPYYIDHATSLDNSYVYSVSSKGLFTKISFNAKVENKHELYRFAPKGYFQLLKVDNDNKAFFMYNADDKLLVLLDKAGKELFKASGSYSTALEIQAMKYKEGYLFCLNDAKTGVHVLYNQQGKALHDVSQNDVYLNLIYRKDQSGANYYLLEKKANSLIWLKLQKGVEEVF
jgi:hypothetical protein